MSRRRKTAPRLTADVLHRYLSEIARREAGAVRLGGMDYDAVRYLHERIGLTYDLLHPYLRCPGVTMFDSGSGTQVSFTDVILENHKSGKLTLHDLNIELEGRFAIVRSEHDGSGRRISLYLGSGSRLRHGRHVISGGAAANSFLCSDPQ